MRELTRYFVTKPKQPRVKKKRGENGTKKSPDRSNQAHYSQKKFEKVSSKKKKGKILNQKKKTKSFFLFPCAVATCAASLFCLACCRRRSLLCVTSWFLVYVIVRDQRRCGNFTTELYTNGHRCATDLNHGNQRRKRTKKTDIITADGADTIRLKILYENIVCFIVSSLFLIYLTQSDTLFPFLFLFECWWWPSFKSTEHLLLVNTFFDF